MVLDKFYDKTNVEHLGYMLSAVCMLSLRTGDSIYARTILKGIRVFDVDSLPAFLCEWTADHDRNDANALIEVAQRCFRAHPTHTLAKAILAKSQIQAGISSGHDLLAEVLVSPDKNVAMPILEHQGFIAKLGQKGQVLNLSKSSQLKPDARKSSGVRILRFV